MTRPPVEGVVPAAELAGDSAGETARLRLMLYDARAYLRTFAWCRSIVEEYFGMGVGEIVAVFLFRIDPAGDADTWLWVVVGDLPSAYLVVDQNDAPEAALDTYCDLMDRWIAAVRAGFDLRDVFPVEAAPTVENAELLARRTAFLRSELLSVAPTTRRRQ